MSDKKPKILFSQAKIAENSGVSQQMVSYILRGDRQPSPEAAQKLEGATGVCREAWLWPERHYNPYMPFSNVSVCVTCKNRLNRIKMNNKVALKIFERASSKIDAFKDMIEAHRLYNGLNESITMIYRATVDGRRLTLAHHNFPLPDAKEERYPWLTDILNETGVLHVPHFPFGIPEEAENEIKDGYKFRIRSGLAVQIKPRPNGKRLGWMIMNFQETMVITPEMIDEMHKQVYRIEDAWIASEKAA